VQLKELLLASTVAVAAAAFVAAPAGASIVTFSGQDDGAPVSGPFPNSAASQASFETAAGAFGPLQTATFEGLPVGLYSPVAAGPGLSITLNAPNDGACISGVANCTYGNLYGFNTTTGGSQWLGFANGSATFNFAKGTHSLGMYLTGLQTVFTTSLTLTFFDGASETLDLPINVNGGAQYYGFTDTAAITSATLTNTSDDAWGIDDVTYNFTPTAVPEPLSITLLGAGLVGLGFARRRRP